MIQERGRTAQHLAVIALLHVETVLLLVETALPGAHLGIVSVLLHLGMMIDVDEAEAEEDMIVAMTEAETVVMTAGVTPGHHVVIVTMTVAMIVEVLVVILDQVENLVETGVVTGNATGVIQATLQGEMNASNVAAQSHEVVEKLAQ